MAPRIASKTRTISTAPVTVTMRRETRPPSRSWRPSTISSTGQKAVIRETSVQFNQPRLKSRATIPAPTRISGQKSPGREEAEGPSGNAG